MERSEVGGWAEALMIQGFSWRQLCVRLPRWLSGNLPASAGDSRQLWVGKIPGEGSDNALQYSCLGDLMDRGAWWATVCGVTEESNMIKTTKQQQQVICHYRERRDVLSTNPAAICQCFSKFRRGFWFYWPEPGDQTPGLAQTEKHCGKIMILYLSDC